MVKSKNLSPLVPGVFKRRSSRLLEKEVWSKKPRIQEDSKPVVVPSDEENLSLVFF